MEDTAATRQATKARIGPWHVLQTRNPAAPGMRYATLLALVNKGQVTARSVVRGPTTHQLWRYAAHVKGLSREFGVCYSCGETVDKTASNCPHCDRAQEPVGNPDALLEAREPVTPSVVSGPHLTPGVATNGFSDASSTDPYSLATRNGSAAPLLSHAERLRTGAEGRPGEVRRRPDGKVLSAMELAAALQVAPPSPPPPQGHPLRTLIITVAIVSIVGGSIVGFARPDLRRQAIDWAQAKWSTVSQDVSNFHIQKPPPADGSSSPSPDVNTAPANTTVQAPVQDVAPQPVQTFPNPQSATVNSTPVPQQMTPPPPAPTPASTIQISPADGASNSNVSPPAPPSPAPDQVAPETPAPARASILPDRPVLVGAAPSSAEIWTLHSRGLEAEGRQDWAEAVHCYEQIEQAPKDQWPSDVKIRLENAQRQLGN